METKIKKEILPAVSAVIFNAKGEVLLQKRNDVNRWCIICGHVEFGESVEEAILREIEEEINMKAEIVLLIGVYSSPASATYYHPDRTVQYVTTYFEIRLTGDPDLAFSNNETLDLKFFPKDNLPADLDQLNPYWLHDALDQTTRAFIR
jgi:8-oxo-dGTP pyrophosphatase MutT (NUDIX family)